MGRLRPVEAVEKNVPGEQFLYVEKSEETEQKSLLYQTVIML